MAGDRSTPSGAVWGWGTGPAPPVAAMGSFAVVKAAFAGAGSVTTCTPHPGVAPTFRDGVGAWRSAGAVSGSNVCFTACVRPAAFARVAGACLVSAACEACAGLALPGETGGATVEVPSGQAGRQVAAGATADCCADVSPPVGTNAPGCAAAASGVAPAGCTSSFACVSFAGGDTLAVTAGEVALVKAS